MKRVTLTRKRLVLKKMELHNKQLRSYNKKKMNEVDRLRIYGLPKKSTLPVGELAKQVKMPVSIDYSVGKYKKRAFVDYDVVICIPSYERYEKVRRLISQFYKQLTKYTFKIILLNDGSTDIRYDTLIEEFPNIIYLKNEKPNGKILHWYCYSQMWKQLKNITCHAVLQMDDDFLISDNFLNTIIDLFFCVKEKNNGVMAIAPHLWSSNEVCNDEPWWKINNHFVDGIALIDDEVIKRMNYEMKPVDNNKLKEGSSAFAWSQIGDVIKEMRCVVYRTPNSLVYHDGNLDSKLHGEHRKKSGGKVFTQKYIGKL
jgi:glycosyltransferase involved in cell wall biosynthesis